MSTEQENKPEPTCFTCHKPIVFDWSKKGKNNRPIPLDPETKEPHRCPTEEKKEEGTKTSESNFQTDDPKKASLSFDEAAKQIKDEKAKKESPPPVESGKEPVKAEYVDHTLARPSEVKIFYSQYPADVEEEYKKFQEGKRFAWTRAQYEAVRDEDNKVLFTICLFYELSK
jgi:hypothetical protein